MAKIMNIISKIYYYLPIKFLLKDMILLESNPDFSDNTRAVFDKLVDLGYNENNKLVWLVSNKEKFNDIKIKNVEFVDVRDIKRVRKYRFLAKYIVDCNNYIYKRNKYQVRIHLTHGAPIKYLKDYCDQCREVDYVIQLADYFKDITCQLFHVLDDKAITTGYPRNDILLDSKNVFFPEIKRNKTICWLPTYRNHKNHSSGKNIFPYGIPSIESENDLKKLNQVLIKESILLVIKLHPAEDVSIVKKLNLDHIKFIDNTYLEANHLTIYHYLSCVDALITDYSSIYYDFLLTKKMIGLTISDLDNYFQNNKKFFDKYQDGIVGDYIYTFDELLEFIYNVAKGHDSSYQKRMEKLTLYHQFIDNNSSKRVIDLLCRRGLKK